jgi:hypothetical protein
MTLRLAALFAFVFVLTGCPEGSDTPDASAPREDAFSSTDAFGSVDAFSSADTGTTMEDAGRPPTEDAAMPEDAVSPVTPDAVTVPDAFVGPATWSDVHEQLTMRCGPCHATIRSGGHNIAQSSVTAAYTDSQLPARARSCTGMTMGACSAQRVRDGSMPPGGLAEPTRSALAAQLDSWVGAGQPGP